MKRNRDPATPPPVPKHKAIQSVYAQDSGYSNGGASLTKSVFKGISGMRSSAAHMDIHNNLPVLRERWRLLDTFAPIARATTEVFVTNVIGKGLKLQPMIDGEVLGLSTDEVYEYQKLIEREFSLWAESKRACDQAGIDDFYGLQQKALRNALLSGDCFALRKTSRISWERPYGLRIQLVEADRCRTPDTGLGSPRSWTTTVLPDGHIIYAGVETNLQEIVAYHFSAHHPHEGKIDPSLQEWIRVPAYGVRTGLPNVIQIMNAERIDQYRGVPLGAVVIESILNLNRYSQAELDKALKQACYMMNIYTDSDVSTFATNQTGEDVEEQEEYEQAIGSGIVNHFKPGERAEMVGATNLAGEFENFTSAIFKQIGASIGVPFEVLMGTFNSSYSASKAALDMAWKTFEKRRDWFVRDFCQPIYEIWFAEAVARRRIQAPGFDDPIKRQAWLGAEWIGPTQGMLDPVKEITAYKLAISEGFMTHDEATKVLTGHSWDKNIERLQIERDKLNGLPPDPHQAQTIQYNGKGGETTNEDK